MDMHLRLSCLMLSLFALLSLPAMTHNQQSTVTMEDFRHEMTSELQQLREQMTKQINDERNERLNVTQRLGTAIQHLTKKLKTERKKRLSITKQLAQRINQERNERLELAGELNRCLMSDHCYDGEHIELSCDQYSDKWLDGGHYVEKSFDEIITTVQQHGVKKTIYTLKSGTASYRMSMVNNKIWVPLGYSKAAILVFDPYTKNKGPQIELGDIGPNSVHQTGPTEVLLASNLGLYVLNTQGSVKYKVAGGWITDMSVICDTAYMYNYSSKQIVTANYSSSQWAITDSFSAGSSHITEYYNTIQVVNGTIYLSSVSDHTIKTYTTTGSYLNTYGVYGYNTPGSLHSPYLCGTDSLGSVLVCDWFNKRFQVLSLDGSWHMYQLEGVRYPKDVIVDTSGNMFVLWWYDGSPWRISKFSMSNHH